MPRSRVCDATLLAALRPGNVLQHPQRVQVGLQNRLVLLALVDVLLAQAHHDTQRLDVEAVALGFGIDIADVVGEGLFFFFEPFDALDTEPKPRVRLAAGTLVALPAGLVPRSPALSLLDRGHESALGTMMFARAVSVTTCEIGGPPTSRAMRATIDRLRSLGEGPVLVDGAIDRIAPLAGGDDAIVLATGAASG